MMTPKNYIDKKVSETHAAPERIPTKPKIDSKRDNNEVIPTSTLFSINNIDERETDGIVSTKL